MKLERSVLMTKKGEKSQTCLINVFNFFLFASGERCWEGVAGRGWLGP